MVSIMVFRRRESIADAAAHERQRSLCPDGWEGYRVVASADRERSFRVNNTIADGVLTIQHTTKGDTI